MKKLVLLVLSMILISFVFTGCNDNKKDTIRGGEALPEDFLEGR